MNKKDNQLSVKVISRMINNLNSLEKNIREADNNDWDCCLADDLIEIWDKIDTIDKVTSGHVNMIKGCNGAGR